MDEREKTVFSIGVFCMCVLFPKKSVFNLPNKSFTRKKGPVLQEKCPFFPQHFFLQDRFYLSLRENIFAFFYRQ